MPDSPAVRLERARTSLEGLSVGDAFGGYAHGERVTRRLLLEAPWHFTDDTMMALSIVWVLRTHKMIDQDALALDFAAHYDKTRGYGPAMRKLLPALFLGADWRIESKKLFKGEGSLGNGGAMRIAPLGGYFADDLALLVEQARLSCEITHAHPEGIAGAIGVAVAAAMAYQARVNAVKPKRAAFIDQILPHLPDSAVRERTRKARDLAPMAIRQVVEHIGNGGNITAIDTVPYCLFCAGEYLDNYEEALWFTASGGGDIDTNCAIVGGIVALYTGIEGIPAEWRSRREPLPEWPFTESA